MKSDQIWKNYDNREKTGTCYCMRLMIGSNTTNKGILTETGVKESPSLTPYSQGDGDATCLKAALPRAMPSEAVPYL